MRQLAAKFIFLFLLGCATAATAGEGKICKVLPQFVDKKGKASLSPSLYERDAYQVYLRRRPALRSSLKLVVQWKAKAVDWSKLKLRAELRGLRNDNLTNIQLEQPAKKDGYFSTWSEFRLTPEQYKTFGELVAWRVTLWEGDRPLGHQESFLWSGVNPSAQ